MNAIIQVDEYIYMLGMAATSLHQLAALQALALKSNWLKEDEKELITAVKFHMVNAFAAIRSYLELAGEHTQIDIEKVRQRLIKRWENNGDSNSISDTGNSDIVSNNSNDAGASMVSKKRGRPRKTILPING